MLVSPDAFDSWRATQRMRFDAELMAEVRQGLATLRQQDVALYTLEALVEEGSA